MQQLTINASASTYVIINISGASVSIGSFQITLTGGIDVQHVFYNLYQCGSLSMSGIALKVNFDIALLVVILGTDSMCAQGALMAPNAAVSFNNGHIDGSIFAGSLAGNGKQLND